MAPSKVSMLAAVVGGAGMRWVWAAGWALGALLLVCGTTVVLLHIDLLWRVPAPVLVLASLLAVAAAPALVPALGAGRRWWLAVVTYAVAGLAGWLVTGTIVPGRQVMAAVLAGIPVPADAGPIQVSGCQYCSNIVDFGTPRPQASREFPADDLEAGCRGVADALIRDGWQLPAGEQSGCGVNLVRRAPFGTTYHVVVTRSAEGDHILPGGGTAYLESQVLIIVGADRRPMIGQPRLR